jgi:hypothetical protein
MRLVIPGLKLVSEANAHEHWRLRAKRAKAQREAVVASVVDAGHVVLPEPYLKQRKAPKKPKQCVRHRLVTPPALPLTVLIVRHSPRTLDEGGNLQTSAKAVQDQLAELLACDDRDPRVAYFVAQRKATESSVEILIEERCKSDICRRNGPCSALPGACVLTRFASDPAAP